MSSVVALGGARSCDSCCLLEVILGCWETAPANSGWEGAVCWDKGGWWRWYFPPGSILFLRICVYDVLIHLLWVRSPAWISIHSYIPWLVPLKIQLGFSEKRATKKESGNPSTMVQRRWSFLGMSVYLPVNMFIAIKNMSCHLGMPEKSIWKEWLREVEWYIQTVETYSQVQLDQTPQGEVNNIYTKWLQQQPTIDPLFHLPAHLLLVESNPHTRNTSRDCDRHAFPSRCQTAPTDLAGTPGLCSTWSIPKLVWLQYQIYHHIGEGWAKSNDPTWLSRFDTL